MYSEVTSSSASIIDVPLLKIYYFFGEIHTYIEDKSFPPGAPIIEVT